MAGAGGATVAKHAPASVELLMFDTAASVGATEGVSMFSDQLVSEPASSAKLSLIYRLHVPFGSVPTKSANDVGYISARPGEGAGAGKNQTGTFDVGLNVPDTTSLVDMVAASSSNRRFTFVMLFGVPQPTLANNVAVWPCGPTRPNPVSLRQSCDRPVSCTVTFVTLPTIPDAVTVDGYTEATALSRIVMGVELVNVLVTEGLPIA